MTLKLGNLTYPIIKSNELSSRDFIDRSFFYTEFSLRIDDSNAKQNLILDYVINLKNDYLENLIKKMKAQISISIYCGDTLYKNTFQIISDRGGIDLGSGNIVGNLEVQAVITSSEYLENYNPPGVNPEFLTTFFELPPGSILALGDKEIFPISFQRIKMESLIRVQLSLEKHPDTFEVNLESNVITILMGKNVMAAWELMRTDRALKPFLYLSVYKDTFVEALTLLATDIETHEFAWAQKLIEKCNSQGIKIESLIDFSSRNQAALLLLGTYGVQKLVIHD